MLPKGTMMVEQCDNCKFYRIRTLPVMGDPTPPPVLIPECRWDDPAPNGAWPQVKPDDWCGRYVVMGATAGREYQEVHKAD
jgi:hypothetical protein